MTLNCLTKFQLYKNTNIVNFILDVPLVMKLSNEVCNLEI